MFHRTDRQPFRRLWRALLVLDTLALLLVAPYIAWVSPTDGPSATPLLMAGLLSLGVPLLALLSAVNAVLWVRRAGCAWWLKLLLVVLAPAGALVVLLLALLASDPVQAGAMKWLWLLLFVLAVLTVHRLNLRAMQGRRARH